jgi:hypothetical protein
MQANEITRSAWSGYVGKVEEIPDCINSNPEDRTIYFPLRFSQRRGPIGFQSWRPASFSSHLKCVRARRERLVTRNWNIKLPLLEQVFVDLPSGTSILLALMDVLSPSGERRNPVSHSHQQHSCRKNADRHRTSNWLARTSASRNAAFRNGRALCRNAGRQNQPQSVSEVIPRT